MFILMISNFSTNNPPNLHSCCEYQFEFPFKLHCLLEDAANEGHGRSIVSWLPHGRAFKIHSKRKFEIYTLPRYYTTSRAPKYRSFQRQLAIYGFHLNIDRASPDRGSYSHPLMVRGRPELCLGMSRQKIKGSTAGERSSSCAAIAGSSNNQRQPLVLNPDAAATVPGFGVLREEEAMSSSGGCEDDLVLEETVSDVAVSSPDIDEQQEHEPISVSMILRMNDDDCHDDLLAFAIRCNDTLAAAMTRSSPSQELSPIDRTSNPLAAFISDASLCSRESTTRVVYDDDGFLGTTANNGACRCSLTMSEAFPSSDQGHKSKQQDEV